MKKSLLVMVLMAICCLGTQQSYALPRNPFKNCPECKGKGRVENWYGGLERCENCGGDGKVCNWYFFVVAGFLLYVFYQNAKGKDKK